MGSLYQVTDAVGTRTFSYSTGSTGHLQLTSEDMNGLIDKTLTRSYATSGVTGRPTGINIASEYVVDYGYDAVGRLNQVKGPGLPAEGANYTFETNSDLVDGILFKSDTSTTIADSQRAYEPYRDLLTQIQNRWLTTSTVTISQYDYVNDLLARRESVVMTGTQAGDQRNVDYSYNERNEIETAVWRTGTTPGSGTGITGRNFSYTFDPIGNRISDTGDPGVTTYTSNNLNQYTATTTPNESFTCDADGNLTADGTVTYEWDAENRLTVWRATTPGQFSVKLEFKYDYMGSSKVSGRILRGLPAAPAVPRNVTTPIRPSAASVPEAGILTC
jgi:YD repeat-containing protein